MKTNLLTIIAIALVFLLGVQYLLVSYELGQIKATTSNQIEESKKQNLELGNELQNLKMEYQYNDVFWRFDYCGDPYDVMGDVVTHRECMAGMNFIFQDSLSTPSAYEYFTELDWEIKTRCNQTDGLDSSLCPLILKR